ncbi:protein kinase domain-containing protein [Phlyctema vagabunda]|uniref:Protein kinase domain-containing protein n=1 Tax=Phlyctema vagabunda TaxID=108571 RepID=A0ABR4PJX4_9HELO
MAQTQRPHERTASIDHRSSWSWRRLFGKDESSALPAAPPLEEDTQRPGVVRRISRKVVPGLPRPGTFKRQQSELRDRLEPNRPNTDERRAVSVDRRRHTPSRDASTPRKQSPRLSAPSLLEKTETIDTVLEQSSPATTAEKVDEKSDELDQVSKDATQIETASFTTEAFEDMITHELESRWILNLSMHFRDKSKREKFFVTYAETPTHLRRVTVSLDYREAPPGSLEEELQETKFQRDKSARIYEAIRESLQDIQFYDTVTNLKLQTENERLHVHVVEDVSEIIAYPSVKAINHLKCRRVREDQIVFESHLSGFVYKVKVDGETFIKKEIPGPDTVDEFLYEINALHQLSGARSVIQFGGVVLDNKGELVKGLLISFAERGALIDVIYDGEDKIPWKLRERWAKQVVQGLSEIHEAGFVQGDFTLSNIVIDEDDNAKIIDINRRGCPVGWEPPEVAALIENNQRISMYIGVKSDLFQLGMVLYALAFQLDEPENQPRPLDLSRAPADVPGYFLDICRRCLSDDPRRRSQAAVLHTLFPEIEETHAVHSIPIPPIVVDAHYHFRDERSEDPYTPGTIGSAYKYPDDHSCNGTHTYVDADELADEQYYFPRRGRSPAREEVVTSDISYSNLHQLELEDVRHEMTTTNDGMGEPTPPVNGSVSAVDELQSRSENTDEKLQEAVEHGVKEAQYNSERLGDVCVEEPELTGKAPGDRPVEGITQSTVEKAGQVLEHSTPLVDGGENDGQVYREPSPLAVSQETQHTSQPVHDIIGEKHEPEESHREDAPRVGEKPYAVEKSLDLRHSAARPSSVVERANDKLPDEIVSTAGETSSNQEPQHTEGKFGEQDISDSTIEGGLATENQAPESEMKITLTTDQNEEETEDEDGVQKTAANNHDDRNTTHGSDKKHNISSYYAGDLALAGVGGVDTNPNAHLFAHMPPTLDDDFTNPNTSDAEKTAHQNEQSPPRHLVVS